MISRIYVGFFMVFLASASQAQAIEGRYRVEGSNPGGATVYHGEALIKKTGATYSVVWQIGNSRQIGTGILSGSVLSVAFRAVGSNQAGVASFMINENRVQAGAWTLIGNQVSGTERWIAE